ncbi:uncharacterized protein LOC122094781 [Macadamia integrifolia]|uniref:uncharacterized protein LOC122094781 n=1 Tax=Macadamia integrifolia TaxID=60698 RepID=UPI001C5295F4|nr:uncharacterized protein LOC122094781 [Macadamia integrifolia]
MDGTAMEKGNEGISDDSQGAIFESDSEHDDVDDVGTGGNATEINIMEGATFRDVNHFRAHLQDFVIQEGFQIVRQKNEKARVTVICKEKGCTWRVHASPIADGITYMIKTFNPKHTCIRDLDNKSATSKWIAEKISPSLMSNPCLTVKDLVISVRQNFKINILYKRMWRARNMAIEINVGKYNLSYAGLPNYGDLILQKMPGFIKGCRPFIGLDGCHLKGRYGGVLLAAVSVDGNNGLHTVAYGVVEVESLGDSSVDLSPTFIPDRQKGLSDAITTFFSQAHQRVCCRHLYQNFKSKYPGILLRDHFWATARAYTTVHFEREMKAIKEINSEAYDWLDIQPPKIWSRHAFDIRAKSDHITNNTAESFNQWISKCQEVYGYIRGYDPTASRFD